MKKSLSIVSLILAGLLLFPLLSCRPALVEVITPPPEEPPPVGKAGFYGVAPELDAELKQIVLADEQVQELIRDKVHTYIADGQTITDYDYNVAVGVYLRQDITPEKFKVWLDRGRVESPLIEEYVGVLNIGYSEKYEYKIDKENGIITGFTRTDSGESIIPEITGEEKARALEIALADDTVRRLLAGKEYTIAPEGHIGLWHDGPTKLGAVIEIKFARPYEIDMMLPRYNAEPARATGEIDAVIISVLLGEERVASIIPRSPVD